MFARLYSCGVCHSLGDDPFNHSPGNGRGTAKVGVLVEFERDRHAGNAEKRPFDRRRHRARVEHVDAGIQSAVYPAHDQVGAAGTTLEQAQFDAIGRAAVDGPAAAFALVEDFFDGQRREIGDRVADAALLGGRATT